MPKNVKPHFLPEELRDLVGWSVRILGEVISEQEGAAFFREIESLREYLKKFRDLPTRNQRLLMQQMQRSFAKKSSTQLNQISHAFSLMLELINRCENAYRSHRIENNLTRMELPKIEHPQNIYWVLTAHPTEARNPLLLDIFEKVFHTLQDALRGSQLLESVKLKALLQLAWKTSLARAVSPTPIDEGVTLFNVLLRKNIVETFLKLKQVGYNFTFRTWVGGDKDGHPFVDEKVLLQSLTLSRGLLLEFLQGYARFDESAKKLIPQLKSVGPHDQERLLKLQKMLAKSGHSPENKLALQLFEIFPNLLIPVEMREEASVINACLAEKSIAKKKSYALFRMLMLLKKLRGTGTATQYSRSLIISMVGSARDVENGFELVRSVFGRPEIKVIPLFENRAALEASTEITKQFLSVSWRVQSIKKFWEGKFEVMVGYSDSSKEMGVFKSRLLVRRSIEQLVPVIKGFRLTPVIFHGSGGSITRGGGSFKEQSAAWPQEAFTHYKATVQGEMVQRTFASGPVTVQNLSHIIEEQNRRGRSKVDPKLSFDEGHLLTAFADQVSAQYQTLVSDPEFLGFVEKATIYSYLNNLTIGSRPAKRRQLNSVSDLRAIPWVLTWTQSRLLMPIWWGIGTSFRDLAAREKKELKLIFAKDPLCSTFLNQAGFSLAKVEEVVFSHYIEQAGALTPPEKKYWTEKIAKEFRLSVEAVRYLSGHVDLTWFKPWLGESITYRAPLIHPLNVIQAIGIKRKNATLIRETTTGIACGMLTTG